MAQPEELTGFSEAMLDIGYADPDTVASQALPDFPRRHPRRVYRQEGRYTDIGSDQPPVDPDLPTDEEVQAALQGPGHAAARRVATLTAARVALAQAEGSTAQSLALLRARQERAGRRS